MNLSLQEFLGGLYRKVAHGLCTQVVNNTVSTVCTLQPVLRALYILNKNLIIIVCLNLFY